MSDDNHPEPPPMPLQMQDFEFGFDPSQHAMFPSPPPLPPSAGLFSPSETTDLFGFLDNFNWEFETDNHVPPEMPSENTSAFLDFAPLHPAADKPPSLLPPPDLSPPNLPAHPSTLSIDTQNTLPSLTRSDSQSLSPTSASPTPSAPAARKTLLSTPQKRLNHIMSEQKRRNAIREGYAQLTTILAPAGAPPGSGMPTRGRPKGSGSRSKGRSKGKSGVLFRAVEYCHWMEESIDALREEVARVEAAAGIHGS